MVDRAAGLGWPRERITTIDEDLGKSGTSSAERQGFQRLIAEIGLGKAGLVVSLDASRLARNNRDWHQLLELCSIFGVLIADGERLYDRVVYHDRLLLGLSGIMSEAELHQIRMRLHQGERQKAMRGELRALAHFWCSSAQIAWQARHAYFLVCRPEDSAILDRLSAPQKSSRVGRIRQKTSACRVSAWVHQKCARAPFGRLYPRKQGPYSTPINIRSKLASVFQP